MKGSPDRCGVELLPCCNLPSAYLGQNNYAFVCWQGGPRWSVVVIMDERSGAQLIFPPRPWQDDIKILKLSCTHCSLGSLDREILQTELRLNENNIFSGCGGELSGHCSESPNGCDFIYLDISAGLTEGQGRFLIFKNFGIYMSNYTELYQSIILFHIVQN